MFVHVYWMFINHLKVLGDKICSSQVRLPRFFYCFLQVFSGSIENEPTKEKSKFPIDFFPDVSILFSDLFTAQLNAPFWTYVCFFIAQYWYFRRKTLDWKPQKSNISFLFIPCWHKWPSLIEVCTQNLYNCRSEEVKGIFWFIVAFIRSRKFEDTVPFGLSLQLHVVCRFFAPDFS